MRTKPCGRSHLVTVSLVLSSCSVISAVVLGVLHSNQEQALRSLIRRGAPIEYMTQPKPKVSVDNSPKPGAKVP